MKYKSNNLIKKCNLTPYSNFMKRYLFLCLTMMLFSATTVMAQFNWNKNPVIAHRGAFLKQDLPENSIAALQEAIRLGCHGSEFDVHQTLDGVLVINHDPEFQGMEVSKTTYEVLRKHKLKNGEELPTLAAFLTAGMAQKRTKLILEIKPVKDSVHMRKVTDAVYTMVKKMHAKPWVEYISFNYDCLLRILERDPKAKTAYLNGDKSLEQLKADRITGADYHFSVYKTGDWFNRSKSLNLTLNAWTVNNEDDMKWLIAQQVEYITTNQPELLLSLLK